MVRAGCVFVAGIHPSRTWTSGYLESVGWNACVHRLDLGLYSHRKEFLGGMEFEPMLTPREKSPLPENFPWGGLNPRRCGQRAQTLPTSYPASKVICQSPCIPSLYSSCISFNAISQSCVAAFFFPSWLCLSAFMWTLCFHKNGLFVLLNKDQCVILILFRINQALSNHICLYWIYFVFLMSWKSPRASNGK